MIDHRQSSMKYLAATVAAALLLLAAPARAQDAHGAIAFGQTAYGRNVAYGFAWNYAGRNEAREAALNSCLSAGGTNCDVLAWFQNGCGALAVDQYGRAKGKGAMTAEQAKGRALRSCKAAGGSGCAVVGSQCARPGGQTGIWSGSESVLAAPEERHKRTARRTAGEDWLGKTGAPRDESLTREERIRVQRGLAALGFDGGPADGMFGPRTRLAIRQWQQAKGLEATGYLTRDEAEALTASGAVSQKKPVSRETAKRPRSGNKMLYFAAAGPKCKGMPKGSSCWRHISNKPRCFYFEFYYVSSATVTWSGSCLGDTAHGRGTLHVSHPDYEYSTEGEIVQGKRQGRWVVRNKNGNISEGPYVDGRKLGHWVVRFKSGTVAEGPYEDDKWHGRWIIRYKDGSRFEGEWSNDSKEGQPGIYVTSRGKRYPGRWSSDSCFRDRKGRLRYWFGKKENCHRR